MIVMLLVEVIDVKGNLRRCAYLDIIWDPPILFIAIFWHGYSIDCLN
jgi:hypothetical protein